MRGPRDSRYLVVHQLARPSVKDAKGIGIGPRIGQQSHELIVTRGVGDDVEGRPYRQDFWAFDQAIATYDLIRNAKFIKRRNGEFLVFPFPAENGYFRLA